MKISDLFEGRVKDLAITAAYNREQRIDPPAPIKQQYTIMFYLFNQYYHGTTKALSEKEALRNLFGRLRNQLGRNMIGVTARDTKPRIVTDTAAIPRSSITIQ